MHKVQSNQWYKTNYKLKMCELKKLKRSKLMSTWICCPCFGCHLSLCLFTNSASFHVTEYKITFANRSASIGVFD